MRPFIAAAIAASLCSCAAVQAVQTHQPLQRAAVQQDEQTLLTALHAGGCDVALAGQVARPLLVTMVDPRGIAVAAIVTAAGEIICQAPLPQVGPTAAAPAT
jgi:hypothetical protein